MAHRRCHQGFRVPTRAARRHVHVIECLRDLPRARDEDGYPSASFGGIATRPTGCAKVRRTRLRLDPSISRASLPRLSEPWCDCAANGQNPTVGEWSDLAETLVELDFAIEDLEGWVTRPEDVDDLKRLEALRDDLFRALTDHHLPVRLRHSLEERHDEHSLPRHTIDPRD